MSRRGLSGADIRERNIAAILRILRAEGPRSRSGLAQRLGLSRSGMTPIVAEMVELGLVREAVGTSTRRGRPPIMLSLTADDFCIIGVELRRDRVGCIAEAIDGSILGGVHRAQESIPRNPREAAWLVVSLVQEAQQKVGRAAVGLGVCLPGDIRTPGRVDAPVLGWNDVPIALLIREALGPAQPEIVVADIAAAATLGTSEATEQHMVRAHIQFGPGLGLGLCDVRPGARLQPEAKGVGHIAWPGVTTRCWCGSRGCLDTVLGLNEVAEDLCRRAGIVRPDAGTQLGTVVHAAQKQDAAIVEQWEEDLAVRIAWVVRLVAQLENPDVITLGGYVCQLDEGFERKLRSHLNPDEGIPADVSVHRSTSDDASMIGVAAIAGNAVLDSPLVAFGAARNRTG